jgi:hypothetical protein
VVRTISLLGDREDAVMRLTRTYASRSLCPHEA